MLSRKHRRLASKLAREMEYPATYPAPRSHNPEQRSISEQLRDVETILESIDTDMDNIILKEQQRCVAIIEKYRDFYDIDGFPKMAKRLNEIIEEIKENKSVKVGRDTSTPELQSFWKAVDDAAARAPKTKAEIDFDNELAEMEATIPPDEDDISIDFTGILSE